MDNEKIANILMKVHADDLKDAEMLADWAEEVKAAGDMAIASALVSRAKTRLSQMAECERSIESVLSRIESEGKAIDFKGLYTKFMNHTAEKLKNRLNEM